MVTSMVTSKLSIFKKILPSMTVIIRGFIYDMTSLTSVTSATHKLYLFIHEISCKQNRFGACLCTWETVPVNKQTCTLLITRS